MSEPMRIGLDNPAFSNRLRIGKEQLDVQKNTDIERQEAKRGPRAPTPIWTRPLSKPDRVPSQPDNRPIPAHALANTAMSALLMPDTETETHRFPSTGIRKYADNARVFLSGLPRGYTRLQMALFGMAAAVFLLGVGVSVQSILTNRSNTAKVTALSNGAGSGGNDGSGSAGNNGSAPSTVKPSSAAVSNYMVAPDLPRYIKIPKLSVYARVMQAGVEDDGSLAAPSNVYDAAWYTGSAKPGQRGAALIDGHVSSWTTNGVFYGLKNLAPDDIIQIERGDGRVIKYKVIKSIIYADNKVDMKAALRPVNPDKSGLNLITCAGNVKPGTNEFDHRIIVFTEQI